MSCNPNELFSFEDVETLWRKCARYGLFLGGFIFKILYVDKQDVPEVVKNTTCNEDFYNQFDINGIEDQIKNRVLDLFHFMVENDFV